MVTLRHYHYKVYGRNLCSDIPLRELPISVFDRRDIALRVGAEQVFQRYGAVGYERLKTNIGPDAVVRRVKGSLTLSFEEWCDFQLSSDGHDIYYRLSDTVDADWIRTTLYSLVIPLMLQKHGRLNLHAGAVGFRGQALAFMAESGTGKSTLIASFAQSGFPFLTDDILALRQLGQGYLALPAYPWIGLSLRSQKALWNHSNHDELDEELKAKVPVQGTKGCFARDPLPLRVLYLIARSQSSSIDLSPVHRAHALGQVLEQSNGLTLLDENERRNLIGAVARFVSNLPVWRLSVPSDYSRLPDVVSAVIEHARSTPSAAMAAGETLSAD